VSEPRNALKDLLMVARPLADLKVDQGAWLDIANSLKANFPKTEYDVIDLCAVYYAFGMQRSVKLDVNVDQKHAPLITKVADFLHSFMVANGQWAYIEAQSWFKRGECAIGIDINYYPDRSDFKVSPKFHKDTGGNNIFANLIFDNKNPIEATEWFVDVEEPGEKRAKWQAALLPTAHLEELATLRQALRAAKVHETTQVNGGVIKGENVYVSWVDDLIWHATPCLNKRIEYTAVDAPNIYNWMKTRNDEFEYQDAKNGAKVYGVELIGTIAEEPKTKLAAWLGQRGAKVQDIDSDLATAAWIELYDKDGGATFGHDAGLRAATPWRITGQYAEANAGDDRLPGGTSIHETPVGLSKIRRVNSVDKLELQKVADANKGVPRTFIRTWVRILRKGNDELAKVKFVPK
jgi:hypothetical protein